MQQWMECVERKMFDEGDMLVINCFAGNDKAAGMPPQEAEFDLCEPTDPDAGDWPLLEFYLNNVPVSVSIGVLSVAGAYTIFVSRQDEETGNYYGACLVMVGPGNAIRHSFVGVCGKDIDTFAGKMRAISALEEIAKMVESDDDIDRALKVAAELLTGAVAGGS